MEALDFPTSQAKHPGAMSGHPGLRGWELENLLIEEVRRRAVGRGFQSSDYEQKRDFERNGVRGRQLVDAVFKECSRLEVARLDLYYRKDVQAEVALSRTRRDFRRLWNAWRRLAVFRSLIGYAWCLEHTPDNPYHFHLLLLFNGHDVKNSYYRASRIGQRWKDHATGGLGEFNVCRESDYGATSYLGRIEAHDEHKRGLLRQYGIDYLCKDDQLLEVKLERVQTFATSALPKRRSNAGRPRLPVSERKPRPPRRLKFRPMSPAESAWSRPSL